MQVHVFVGPTLEADRVRDLVRDAAVHPPIAHGDLIRLNPERGDIVVIIDGYFHHNPPVRHKEILAVLACGVSVVGCSSMGALRAAELHRYGMVGNGAVFQLYRSGTIESDEDVATAHGDAPEYIRFGEPMVGIRTAVTSAEQAGVITHAESQSLLTHAATITYGQRSWCAVEQSLRHSAPHHLSALERLTSYLATNAVAADVKKADAIDTLRRLPALVAAAVPPSAEWTASDTWRSRHLYEWQATFGRRGDETVGVSDGAVLRYHQLYLREFPQLWRAFVVEAIVSAEKHEPIGVGGHEGAVLDIAGRHGIGRGRALTSEQAEEWLTESETAELTADETTVRVLTRSYRPGRGLHDLVTAFPHLVHDVDARRAVAESEMVNAEVATWNVGQGIEHIRKAVLLDHLVQRWDLSSADQRTVRAHARDRGFAGIAEATDAARQFLLRERILPTP